MQVPLDDVDTTKADGENLTLVVVEVVKRKTILAHCIVLLARLVSLILFIIQVT